LRAVQRAELRASSVGAKARQLAALMASAHLLGRRRLAAEDAATRRRWGELQRRFRAEA
jgi:hypothetical protein